MIKLMGDAALRERIATKHIPYEVHALWTTALDYAAFPIVTTPEQGRIQNARLESCMVHARLLDDFLSKRADDRYEDVVAGHYLATWKREQVLSKTEIDRINWTIMHLSAERERLGGGLDLVDTAERIVVAIGNFIGQITDPTVRGWFTAVASEQVAFARRRSELEREGKLVRYVATTNPTTSQVLQSGSDH